MPFDGIEPLAKLAPLYAFGNDKLAELEWLLRHPERWPGHQWDFGTICDPRGDCGTVGCAWGLAEVRGIVKRPVDDADPDDHEQLGIGPSAFDRIFMDCVDYRVDWDAVTPLMVADAIRRYMVTGKV